MASRATTRQRVLILLSLLILACPVQAQDWFLPRTEQILSVRYGDVEEIAGLLKTMVPDAFILVTDDGLMVKGTPGMMDQLKVLLRELDQPFDEVILDVRLFRWEEVSTSRFWSERLSRRLLLGAISGDEGPTVLNRLSSEGHSTLLANERLAISSGKAKALNLPTEEPGSPVRFRVRPKCLNSNVIETQIEITSSGRDSNHSFRRKFKDGETICIKGFLTQPYKLTPEVEIILMLTPHLMR